MCSPCSKHQIMSGSTIQNWQQQQQDFHYAQNFQESAMFSKHKKIQDLLSLLQNGFSSGSRSVFMQVFAPMKFHAFEEPCTSFFYVMCGMQGKGEIGCVCVRCGVKGKQGGGDRASCIVLFLKVLFLLMVHDIYALTKTDGSKANLLSVNSTNTGGMQKQFMK